MDEAMVSDALPCEDHQAALEIINQLGDCRTLEELNQVLKTALIPLMDCNGVFYTRLDGERETPQLLDDINQSPLCQHHWKNFLEVAIQSQLMDSSLSGEVITPLATETFCCTDRHCRHCTIYPRNGCDHDHRCCAIVALFDAPKPAVALYFCRLTTQEQFYSTRDFELLLLLRATLLQTVKAVIYQEESRNLQQMLEHMPGHDEPVAVVRADGALVYKNQVFDQVVGQENFIYLSRLLVKKINAESSCTDYDCYLSQLGRRFYEVMLIPINNADNDSKGLFLLRFTRVTNKSGLIDRKLDKAGLTSRELEIAALIYQGISTHSISDLLSLSYHTVRNHIKHIYSKTGVSTRSELLTWGG